MPISSLSEEEKDVVQECLDAAVYGPFFDEEDFHALFGVTRDEAKVVADHFPKVDEFDDSYGGNDDSWLVINNTFANLLGYPHRLEKEWVRYISVSRERVEEIFIKWRS